MASLIDFETGLDLQVRQLCQEIQEEDDFSTLVINSTQDGILAYDRELRYTLWNPAIEQITGVRKEDIIGRNVFEVFPNFDRPEIRQSFSEVLAGKSHYLPDHRYHIEKTGRKGYSRAWISPLQNEKNQVVGGLAIVRDITTEKAAADEIQRLNQNLQETLTLITRAGALLAAPFDFESSLQKIIDLVSRHFDGWCIVRLLHPDGSAFDAFMGSYDPELDRSLREFDRDFPLRSISSLATRTAIYQRVCYWCPRIQDSDFILQARSEEHLRRLRGLELKSHACVPLLQGEGCLGALSVFSPKRHFLDHERPLLEDLARRFALAAAFRQLG